MSLPSPTAFFYSQPLTLEFFQPLFVNNTGNQKQKE
jgi:hypothetical protein